MEQKNYWNRVSETKEFTTPFQAEEFGRYVRPEGLILDVGCGYGRTLNQLHELGYRNLMGMDFSEGMIRRGKETFPWLDLRVMESGRIDLPDASVDAVILFAVLTCIISDEEQAGLIREIRRVLKPEGILYVNDFLLNTDARNLERYEKYQKIYGTYGVFELPEGAVLRHQEEDWIHRLLSGFSSLRFEHLTFTTMNGHTSNGFYFIGKKKKRPVVIDCDPGVDDTLAILLAASSPDLDIRAINPVAGNVPYSSTSQNTLRLCDYLNLDCPVGQGAQRPLILPPRTAGTIHGTDGLGGYQLPLGTKELSPRYAWDLLLEEAEKARGELEVIVLGPMTNIAIALKCHPQLKHLIKKITLMAGASQKGNTTPYAEFNVWVDPHACEIVFQSGIPLAMCGLEGNSSCMLREEEMYGIFDTPSRVTELTSHIAHFIHNRNTRQWNLPGSTIHDLVTMACFLDPSIARYQPCHAVCEVFDKERMGQTIIDPSMADGRQPNLELLLEADKERYKEMLQRMMAWYAA